MSIIMFNFFFKFISYW